MAPLTRGPERAGGDFIFPCGGRAMELSPYMTIETFNYYTVLLSF